MARDRSISELGKEFYLPTPVSDDPSIYREPSKLETQDRSEPRPGNKTSSNYSRSILSRDFLAHVLGDRQSPERGSYHCLDPIKFNPPKKSSECLSEMPLGMSNSYSAPDFRSRIHLSDDRYSMDTGGPSPARVRFEKDQKSDTPKTPRRDLPFMRSGSPSKMTFDEIREEIMEERGTSPVRRSRSPVKQLFGEGGFLGRSLSYKEQPSERYKKTGLKYEVKKMKQRLWDKTEDLSKMFPPAFTRRESPSKDQRQSTFEISLNPEAQCRVYAEMELMICAVANQYLMTQLKESRMSVESVAKVTAFWKSKNRPQVIEFLFDQQTQCELIYQNMNTFRFYGPKAENPVALNAMLLAWKSMAREMSVRTFCSPDSMIRKQLHDSYKVLELLGAPAVTFFALQQVQKAALKTMKEKVEQRAVHDAIPFGVEKKWTPPVQVPDQQNPFI